MNKRMNSTICEFSFNLRQWQIVCDKTLTVEDWQQGELHWLNNAASWQPFTPSLAFLPPLKRRRLSPSARLFFEAAWPLTEQSPPMPVVYASLNSEISRSFALWQTLLQEGDVSPTSFSLSVHNALIGQWSELQKNRQEMTALTSTEDNLEIALLEANLLLNDGHSQVLVVVAESPLEPCYNATVKRLPFAYALAMVVEKGEQYRLSLHSDSCTASLLTDSSLNFVHQQYLAHAQWQTPRSKGYWQWHKN